MQYVHWSVWVICWQWAAKGRVPFQRPFWWRSMLPVGFWMASVWQQLSLVSPGIRGTAAAVAEPNIWQKGRKVKVLSGRLLVETVVLRIMWDSAVIVNRDCKQHGTPLPRWKTHLYLFFKVVLNISAMIKDSTFDRKASGTMLDAVAYCMHGGSQSRKPILTLSACWTAVALQLLSGENSLKTLSLHVCI